MPSVSEWEALRFNQLEPEALIQAFMRHPPVDFTIIKEGDSDLLPKFATSFDLMTTLEPALRRRLQAWVNRWGMAGWLRPRALFIGTTVSEYALLPRNEEPGNLIADLLQRYRRHYAFIIIKDVPVQSPLLEDADNTCSRQWSEQAQAAGMFALKGQALAWVDVGDADEETWLNRFSKSRRKDFRRKLRQRHELEITTLYAGDPCFQSESLLRSWYALYEAVYQQSDTHFDFLTPAFFADLLQEDSGAVIFVYHHQGVLLGYNFCFEVGDKLVDKYIGLRYPQAQQLNLYFVSWFHNLAYARSRGLTRYVAGWTDPEVKRSLGAALTMTQHWVYIRNPWLRWILGRLRFLFEADARVESSS